MKVGRQVDVHERPDYSAGERREKMPVVDEDDATFACNQNADDAMKMNTEAKLG
jgi:hypothetical protein